MPRNLKRRGGDELELITRVTGFATAAEGWREK
jgi:hypothetical protein